MRKLFIASRNLQSLSLRVAIASVTALLCIALGVNSALAHATNAPSVTVVATGLNNPRGISYRDGALYIAEAGLAGTDCVGPTNAQFCYGATGSITRVSEGHQQRIITGLPSARTPEGDISGPSDVSAVGDDSFYYLIGGALNHGSLVFGGLYYANEHKTVSEVANISAFQGKSGLTDSDPYGLYVNAHGDETGHASFVVADAAANNIVQVNHAGQMSIRASFPNLDGTPIQSVPTAITRGPDGAYYVSELTGAPFIAGAARIWRVEPREKPEVYATGFTNVIDLKFGPDGKLYVLEIAKKGLASGDLTGAFIRYNPHTKQQTTILDTGLRAPTGFAFDQKGHVYITNNGVFPGSGPAPFHGEVLKVSLQLDS